MCLRSISGAKQNGVALYVSASRLLPWEPDLVWTDADTGGTKFRDHPKVVGSRAQVPRWSGYHTGTYTTCF